MRVPRMGASYAPEFEWREAARWDRLSWQQFEALDGEEQSAIVAHYRGHHQLEAVISQEQTNETKRRHRRGAR